MVNVWGLVEVTKFHQIRGDSSDQMYRIFDHSHQIEESHFSQELHYASLTNSHDIAVPLHTPGAYDQCSVFDHSGDKQSVVLGTRYGTSCPWHGQFEVG